MKPDIVFDRRTGKLSTSDSKPAKNAQRPSKRDVSTNDEPSSEVGPQAEASLAGTGTEMPADQEGHISREPESTKVSGPTNIEELATKLNELLAEKAARKAKHNARIQRYRATKRTKSELNQMIAEKGK